MNKDYCLWILMRNDLASLTPGKAMAQAAHAANQFIYEVEFDQEMLDALDKWSSGNGFGTTVVLSANIDQIMKLHKDFEDKHDSTPDLDLEQFPSFYYGLVTDPIYPLLDGKFLHSIPLVTCMYLFGRRDHQGRDVAHLSLYP